MIEIDRRRSFVLPDGLPPLRGLPWRLFLLLWSVTFGLTLFGGVMQAITQTRFSPGGSQAYGVLPVSDTPDGTVQFTIGNEAWTAGIRPGDRIVTIDGAPVSDIATIRMRITAIGSPPVITVLIAKPDGRRLSVRLTNDPRHVAEALRGTGMNYAAAWIARSALMSAITFVMPLALAALLLIRRPRDPLAPWASLMMVITALGLGTPFTWYLLEPSWEWLTWLAVPLAGATQIAVLALFPGGRFTPRWTWAVLLGVLPLLYWMRVDATALENNVASLAGLSAAVAVVLARYRAMAPGAGRQQIRWTLFGFGLSIVFLALTIVVQILMNRAPNLALYLLTIDLEVVVIGACNLFLLAGMAIGLMRYRLYDADVTISRSITYGLLTVALLCVFAGSKQVIDALCREYLGGTMGAFAGVASAMLVAVMIAPLHDSVTRWAKRRFGGGLVQLREKLPQLAADLRERASPAALAEAVLPRILQAVRARHGAIVMENALLASDGIDAAAVHAWLARGSAPADQLDRLHADRTDPLLPMRVPLQADGVGLVGWLLLGPRPDGSFFGRDEREALAASAEPLARALAIAADRTMREEQRDREIASLRRFMIRLQEQFGLAEDIAPKGSATA